MRFGVLGPLQVRESTGRVVRVPGPARRQVLAALLCRAGQTVTASTLMNDLWGDAPPRTAAKTLQSHIVRLRDDLGRGAAVLVTDPAGYRLEVEAGAVDAVSFEQGVRRARELSGRSDSTAARRLLGEALSLWRGAPYEDIRDGAFAISERIRLTELRSHARELSVELALRAGAWGTVIPDLEQQVAEEPFRERGWQQLALALYRDGRQADALAAIGTVSQMLREELGVDPGTELAELQVKILRHDPGLEHLYQPPATGSVVTTGAKTRPADAVAATMDCPYRGLSGYQERDAAVFVGRERLAAEILAMLADGPPVAVVGPSGSGKSSLLRAGVVPALRRGAVPRSTNWRITVCTPSGWEPILDRPDLLVIDQAEELFGLADDAQRDAIIAELTQCERGGSRLVVVLRGDYYGRLTEVPPLDRWAQRATVLVGPMRGDEIRRVVVEPAGVVGLSVEHEMAEAVLSEIDGRPEALPMLSAALVAAWENRDGDRLTLDGYRRGGGVAGAIEAGADRVYEALSDSAREQARQLLVRLANQDGGTWMRRSMPPAEAAALAHEDVLDALAAGRLITLDTKRVQLTHESLLDRWPKLRAWLDDRALGAEMLDHLSTAARAWDDSGRAPADLYRGARLQAALDWDTQHPTDATMLERDFLADSESLAQRELADARSRAEREATASRRLRRVVTVLAAVVVLAVAGTAVAVVERGAARVQRREAQAAAVTADSQKLSALALTVPDLRTSLLLATAAYRLQNSPDSRSGLLSALERSGSALWVLPTAGRPQWVGTDADGSTIWAVDQGRIVTMYDAHTHDVIRTFPLDADAVAALSPDSRYILAVGPAPNSDVIDGPTRGIILDASTGRLERIVPIPMVNQGTAVRTAVFTGDGRWLIAVEGARGVRGATTNRVAVLDLHHPEVPARTLSVRAKVVGIAAGRDTFAVRTAAGDLLLVRTSDLTVLRRGRRPELRRAVATIEGQGVLPMSLSPDGRRLAIVRDEVTGSAEFVDTSHLSGPVQTTDDFGSALNQMTFSPDGDLVAIGTQDGPIGLVDASDATTAVTLNGNNGQVMGLAWIADGKQQGLYAGGLDSQIVFYDTQTRSRLLSTATHAWPATEYPEGGGTALYGFRPEEGAAPESHIHLVAVDARTGTVLRNIPLHLADADSIQSLSQDTDHRLALVAITRPDGSIYCKVLNLATGRLLKTITPSTSRSSDHTFGAVISPDGTYVIASIADQTLATINLATGARSAPIPVTFDGANGARTMATPLAFAPDGRILIDGFDPGPTTSSAPPQNQGAVLLDTTTGRTSRTLYTGAFGTFSTVAWSKDHQRLAIPTNAGTVIEADATTLREISQVQAAAGYALTAAFSPDDQTIATTSSSGTVALFDADTLRPIGKPIAANGLTTWWTPAGNLSGLQNGQSPATQRPFTISARPQGWAALACNVADSNLTHAEYARYIGDHTHIDICPG